MADDRPSPIRLRIELAAALIDGGGTTKQLAQRTGWSINLTMWALKNMVAAGDARFYMDLSAANHNIDLWENVTGTSTYRSTWSTFGWNQSGITYRIVVDRAGGAASGWFTNQNDDKIRIFASNNGFASGTCPNNATPTANCALIGVSTNTHTMAVKFMVYFNTAGNVAANVYEQADKGLQ